MRRLLFSLLLFCAVSAGAYAQRVDPTLVIEAGGHARSIKMVAFTRDGEYLISVGDDNTIRVWNRHKHKLVKVVSCRGLGVERRMIMAAVLSPDDKLVAVAGDFKDSPANRYAVHIYEVESGRLVSLLARHTSVVTALAFSPDGCYLASGSDFTDKRILVWKAAAPCTAVSAALTTGPPAPVAEIRAAHDDRITSLAFSPDGKLLASGSDDNTVKLWDWAKGTESRQMRNMHSHEVKKVAFSPDGRYLVSGGLDKKIFFWDLKDLTPQGQGSGMFGLPSKIIGRALGANGPSRRLSLQNGVWDAAFSPDGKVLLVGELKGGCELFNVQDGAAQGPCKREDNVTAVAFAPDGDHFATSGGFNGEVYLEELHEKRCAPVVGKEAGAKPCRELAGRGQTVWSVGFAPDGGSIAFGNKRTADDPRGYGPLEQVFTLKQGGAYTLSLGDAVGPEANFIRSALNGGGYELKTRFGQRLGDETIIYDPELQVLKQGKLIQTIRLSSESGHVHKSFTLTGDGRVISGAEDGHLAMYNAETGAKEMDFTGHRGDVWALAVSRDNRLLVSGSSDQTVRLWDIKTGTNLLTIFVADDYEWIASTPEGYYTSSLNGDRYLGWMYKVPGEAAPQFYRASQFQKVYYRPGVVSEYLKTTEYLQRPDIRVALEQANGGEGGQLVTGLNDPRLTVDWNDPIKFSQALPPRIKLEGRDGLGPAGELETSSQLFTLKFAVESPENLPITDIGVFINGVRKNSFKRETQGTTGGIRVNVEMQVSLDQAENMLSIVASNERATSSTEVLRVMYKPGPGDLRQPEQEPQPTPAAPRPDGRPAVRPTPRPRSALPVRFEAVSLAAPQSPDPIPEIQVVRPALVPATVEESELVLDLKVDFKTPCPMPDDQCHVIRTTLDGTALRPVNLSRVVEETQLVVPLSNEATENTLRIVASNGQAESAPLEWKFNFRPRVAAKPNLIFLGIGISTFKTFQPRLNFAREDAEEVLRYIKTQGEDGPYKQGALYKEVIPKLLRDDEANLRAINDSLQWLNDQTRHENDVRVVFISTHGGAKPGGSYYLYSWDQEAGYETGTSLPLIELWTTLSSGKGRTFLFIDACRFGAPRTDDIVHFVKLLNQNNTDSKVIPFLAAGSNRPSFEKQELKHGLFTYAFLQGLGDEAKLADNPYGDKDGRLTVEELRNWLVSKVSALDSRQHPSPPPPFDGMDVLQLYMYQPVP